MNPQNMSPQKFRWSKVYESSEEELTAFLHSRNITSRKQDAEAFEALGGASTGGTTTWYCAEGSLHVFVAESDISLQPGDALRIPQDYAYEISAGMTGYICYVADSGPAEHDMLET